MHFHRPNDSSPISTTKSACNLTFKSKQSFVTVSRTSPKSPSFRDWSFPKTLNSIPVAGSSVVSFPLALNDFKEREEKK